MYQEIELESNLEHGPLCFINVSEIKQVLLNIFMNAMEAMPSGGCLTIHTYVKEKNYLAVDITDTGIGIEQEALKKIFEPFFTTKEEGKGTGLGLWITYGIIKSFQGDINVESTKGVGSKFILTLPINK